MRRGKRQEVGDGERRGEVLVGKQGAEKGGGRVGRWRYGEGRGVINVEGEGGEGIRGGTGDGESRGGGGVKGGWQYHWGFLQTAQRRTLYRRTSRNK